MRPAPASLFFLGIIGFIVSAYLIAAELLDASWGTAFCLTFLIMFISGVVSMTPKDEIDYKLSLDEDDIPKEDPEEKIAPVRKKANAKKKKK